MTDWTRFDDERLEWEFERLREEHEKCCTGALLFNGSWLNVICHVFQADGTPEPLYRPFDCVRF